MSDRPAKQQTDVEPANSSELMDFPPKKEQAAQVVGGLYSALSASPTPTPTPSPSPSPTPMPYPPPPPPGGNGGSAG